MKVYTITTHFANNYGALLQSYALSRFLNSIDGIECEILNYLPAGPQSYRSSWTIFNKPTTFRDFIKLIYMMCRIDKIRSRHKKNAIMRNFIESHLPVTTKKLYKSTISKEKICADAVICGSDQIWNREIFLDTAYFLDFVPDDVCKIAYAPSIATSWKDSDLNTLRPLLERFSALSVREDANVKQVTSLVPNKDVRVVCDPVFLLSPDIWSGLSKRTDIPDNYIFCYFLGASDFAVNTVAKIRKLTGCKVVHLQITAIDRFDSDSIVRMQDPFDFVGLIKNASYVCTNSFHCSAFSILFKKNLYAIPNSKRNERLENLQKQFHVNFIMSEDIVSAMTAVNLATDYSHAKCGDEFVCQSKEYLINALKTC